MPPILLEGDEFVHAPAAPGPHLQDEEKDEGQLPEAFGTGKLLLLPRDPTSLYAAWDFTAKQQQRANAQSIDRHMVLLIWKGGTGRQLVSEIHVHPESRHWFATVPAPGETYCAELGYYDAQRNWCTMAFSSAVTTPKGAPSSIPSVFEIRTIAPAERVPEPTGQEQQAFPVAEQPWTARQAPPELPKTAARAIALETCITALGPLHEQVPSPAPVSSERVAEREHRAEWTQAEAMEILAVAGLAPGNVQGLGSIEIVELLARGLPVPPGAQGAVSSLEAGQFPLAASQAEIQGAAGVSSLGPTQPAGEAQRNFWFQVNAELVVYGATEPDATVTIGGRQIRLREDGTFSYRFSLPDGSYQLPIEATSRDGDRRGAAMAFSRGTSYAGEVGVHPQYTALKKPEPENVS